VISSFITGVIVTQPLHLAGAFQQEISPQIQVLSILVLLVSAALLLLLASQPQGRRERERGG
jgi:ABC-type spermidine/putrescine transport system permease subunit II